MSTETQTIEGTAAPEVTALVIRTPQSQPVPVTSPTPMMLVERALSQGSDIDLDRMERLMNMQMAWDKENARKAFLDAMAQFRANAPELHKNCRVNFTSAKGTTDYKHADLEEVSIPIGRVMGPLGLSFRFDVKQEGQRIFVTTILQHSGGHSEQLTLNGAPDDSGNKNSIQAVGSTITYLERYGLLAITGMAVKGQDDDGRGPKAPVKDSTGAEVPAVDISQALADIASAPTVPALVKAFNLHYGLAQKGKDRPVMEQLMDAQNKRKAEITKGGAK